MTTIQGIISKGIINAENQFERMGYIASNASNLNTNSYKAVRFEQILNENGYLSGVERTDFSPGSLKRTERELDVAIDGIGFIPVTSPAGDVVYTRVGSFTVDKDGYIVTDDGYLVGDGIQVPVNYDNILIDANGKVTVSSFDGSTQEVLGEIPLVCFQNPEGLKAADNNKYYLTAQSGEPVLIKNHSRIKQGNLEASNVDLISQSNDVMRINASLLASFKVMSTINRMYANVLQLNQ